jgi:hypothetical protein
VVSLAPAWTTHAACLQEPSERLVGRWRVSSTSRRVARRRACPRVPARRKMDPSRTPEASDFRRPRQHSMPICWAFGKPSDGLEPSTPSLPCDVCGERSLTGATVSACSRPFSGLRRAILAPRCPLVFPKSFHRSARCDRLCSISIGPKRAV